LGLVSRVTPVHTANATVREMEEGPSGSARSGFQPNPFEAVGGVLQHRQQSPSGSRDSLKALDPERPIRERTAKTTSSLGLGEALQSGLKRNIFQREFDTLFCGEDADPTRVWRTSMIVELQGTGHFKSSKMRSAVSYAAMSNALASLSSFFEIERIEALCVPAVDRSE
jgi:hypothetical protein